MSKKLTLSQKFDSRNAAVQNTKPNGVPFDTRVDGWVNALTNLGVLGKDKKMSAYAEFVVLDLATLDALYQANAIAAKIIDRPVYEMLRQGYKIVSPDMDQSKIEELRFSMETMEVDEKIEEAMKLGRLYGGGAIYMGVNDGLLPAEPLDLSKIKSVDYMIVLDRHELQSTGILDKDVRSSNFGWPLYYRLNTNADVVYNQNIHHSRLIRFYGVRHNRRISAYFNYWGDSVLSRVYNALRNYGTSHDVVPTIIQDFTQIILKMVDLPEILSQGDDSALMKRLQLVSMTSSIINAMIIRAEEEVEKKSTSVAGLKEIIETVDNALLAATDMPHTILFNDAAGGLGSTGDSELTHWYDHIKGMQKKQLLPALNQITDIFMAAKMGPIKSTDNIYTIEFKPLQQASEKEEAELRKIVGETDALYIDRGVVDSIEIAKSRFGTGKYSMETTIDLDMRNKMEPEVPDDDDQDEESKDPENSGLGVNQEIEKEVALNGAQVTSMIEIVTQVSQGQMPRETGLEMMQAAYAISKQQAEKIMGKVGKGFKPEENDNTNS